MAETSELTDALRTSVILAREYLKEVQVAPEQVKYLVEEARRGGVQGHRSELFAIKVGGWPKRGCACAQELRMWGSACLGRWSERAHAIERESCMAATVRWWGLGYSDGGPWCWLLNECASGGKRGHCTRAQMAL